MSKIYKIGNVGFVHMPKTGGTSVRVFAEKNLQRELVSIETPETVSHTTPGRTKHFFNDYKLRTMVFVRNPFNWLKSSYKYLTKYPNVRPDAERALGNPFCFWSATFAARLLKIIHEGDFKKTMVYWFHHDRFFLYDLYGAFTSGAYYVGRSETLEDDLFSFLGDANGRDYSIERALFQDMKKQNVSEIDVPKIDVGTMDAFYSVNRQLYERFGYETN